MSFPAWPSGRGTLRAALVFGGIALALITGPGPAQAQSPSIFQERSRVIAEIVAQDCVVDEEQAQRGAAREAPEPDRTYASTVTTLQSVGLIVPSEGGRRRLQPVLCTPADTGVQERLLSIFALEGCRSQLDELAYWYEPFGLEALPALAELTAMYAAGGLALDATSTRLVVAGGEALDTCMMGQREAIAGRVQSVVADLARAGTCSLPLREFTGLATQGLLNGAPSYTRIMRAFQTPDSGSTWGLVDISYAEGNVRILSEACAPEEYAARLRAFPDVQPLATALAPRNCRLVAGEHGDVIAEYPDTSTILYTQLPLWQVLGILHRDSEAYLTMDRAYCTPTGVPASDQARFDPAQRQVLLDLFAAHDCVLTQAVIDAEGPGMGLRWTLLSGEGILTAMQVADEVVADGDRFKLLAPLCQAG